jgi:hypothetical protein
MKKLLVSLALIVSAGAAGAQEVRLARVPADRLAVTPPSGRVAGPPGEMHIIERSCRALPSTGLRRRIVDIAVQEWGFFGFNVVDQTNIPDTPPSRRDRPRRWRRTAWLDPEESARVADSIAGYWAITPDGDWILSRQNDVWNEFGGVASRWRDPWSAAFISWVMCEAGLAQPSQFRRAIAHHTYIDQAIVARDTGDDEAAFIAYDIGETSIDPGDLLCSGRRPHYRKLEERRRQLGTGIRSHCDIVVKIDRPNDRILVIGGNVRGTVSLKLHAAVFTAGATGGAGARSVGRGRRNVFAHLKLRAEPVEPDAFEASPTIRALADREDAAGVIRERLQDDSALRAQTTAADTGTVRASGSGL